MFFELEKYAPTKELVTNYKDFLKKQFTVCGLVFSKDRAEAIKKTVNESRINGWKYVQKKNDDFACIYLINKRTTSTEIITSILESHPEITFIKFLKGLGRGN